MAGNEAPATTLALSTALHLATTAITVFRLRHRYRIRELWYDDCWAGLALVCSLAHMTGPMWWSPDRATPNKDHTLGVTAFWVSSVSFGIGVWAARLSLSTSITRFVPFEEKARRFVFALSVSFGVTCLACLLAQVIVCVRDPTWHNLPFSHMSYHHSFVRVLIIFTNVAGDASLVAVPLCMLFFLDLPRKHRQLLGYVLFSSMVSLAAGVVYVVFVVQSWASDIWQGWKSLVDLMGHLKLASTILVGNLPATIIYLRGVLGIHEDNDEVFRIPATKVKSRPTLGGLISTRRSSESLALTEISESWYGWGSLLTNQISNTPRSSNAHSDRASVIPSDDGSIMSRTTTTTTR